MAGNLPGPLYLVGTLDEAADGAGLAAACRSRLKVFRSIRDLLDIAGFLAPGCVIIDLAVLGSAEDDLVEALSAHAAAMPIVILGTPATPVATAVAAMRAGAADYLVAPLGEGMLVDAVRRAVARFAAPAVTVPADAPAAAEDGRLARLSRREREVLVGLLRGATNKMIGRDLGISPRTVELHRAHLMERMNVRSLAELLQVANAGGLSAAS